VKNGKATQVTSGRFGDSVPTFDRKGDYLFFASSREISGPLYDDLGTNWIYANSEVLVCVPLRSDLASPFAPRSDEEEIRKDEEKEGEAGGQKAAVSQPASQPADSQPASQPEGEDKTKDEPRKPLVIDLDGFEARAVQIPVKRGQFLGLAVNHEGKLIYGRGVSRGVDGEPAIKIFDLNDEKREEKTVVEGTGSFAISADGKKLLIRKGATAAIVDAAADQKLDKPMPLTDMHVTIEPRAEWQQIFTDAWRIQRDFFYDPNMHGLDWKKLRDQYGKMLADCVSREDVQYVIAEMISELNVGHAYVTGAGDVEEQPQMNVGLLGCDFTLDNGAFRISRIYRGAAWDLDARGPLGQPGVAVREGDYLLAVNRVPLDTTRDPWAALAGLGGKTVVITVGPRPLSGAALNDAIAAAAQRAAAERSKDKERGKDKDKDKKKDDGGAGDERKAIDWEEPREVAVELVSGEGNLRYRAWIEQKRQYVSQRSDDRVGYIYVPNTGVDGQNDLVRQFFGQLDKEALIIDERWNGGGQIPTRFIELLNRPITNYWARRDGNDWPWPPDSHQGPKCMLINGLAGSGGDAFPAYFRMSKLGKLIGMRTWGGLVGISGNPGLVDGGGVTAPTFAYYDRDGTWGIEGHGVDPDIEVIDDPARMRDGADPQLDAAIALMLEELQKNPYLPPKRPPYPDRTGMGIPEEDK